MRTGPVIIGFDGSSASVDAVREAAGLFAPRPALVVVVWEAGRAFDLAELPTLGPEFPPTALDIRTAAEIDREMYEAAQHLAERGAALAKQGGLDAEGLAVADELTVADTLVRLAEELDAQAVVVGTHGHRGLRELLLGSTTRTIIQHAPCPTVVVRGAHASKDHADKKV
jgi:nucleotide-binding universal stress UspA family protein